MTTRPATAEGKPTIDWLHLVQAEYLEMPGLQLTRAQVQRLWGLDAQACDTVLDGLLAVGFLRRTVNGAYILDAPSC